MSKKKRRARPKAAAPGTRPGSGTGQRLPNTPADTAPDPEAPAGRTTKGYASVAERGGGSSSSRTARARPRADTSAKPPARGRLSESLRAESPFPPFLASLLQGLAAVASSPLLLALPLILVPALWLTVVAIGLDHFPAGLVDLFAIPPISTFFDIQLGATLYGPATGALLFTVVATVIRSVIWALLAGMIVEAVEFRTVTLVGLLRGLAAFPAVLAVNFLHVVLILTSNLILPAFLGPSVGQLGFTAAVVGGLYLLTFAPIIAARSGGARIQVLRRSVRGSVLPGSRHLIMVLAYFLLAIGGLIRLVPGLGSFTANAGFATWAVVLASNYFHLAYFAAFAYRWLVVEGRVADEPVRARRGRRPLAGRLGTR